ncbi:MAG: sulfatase [Planctomycetota bacterium]
MMFRFLTVGFLALTVSSVYAEHPNVLLIMCDDLNCDLGCYGDPIVRSPNIDRLAERGVRFNQAHCQYPLCGPSRASMMTGLYPDQTLIKANAIRIRQTMADVITMPQAFRAAGYMATRVGKIYHYNVPRHIGTAGHDDPYSWNRTFNPRGRDVDDEPLIFSLRPGSFGGTLSWLAADGTDEEQTDGIGADTACDLLREHANDEAPFFLAVGLFRPHTPYVAPKKYFELYPTEEIDVPEVPDGYFETIPHPAKNTLLKKKDQRNLPKELGRQAIQAYHASITFADKQIGKILDALDDSELTKNTIVVFTSDHGYHLGEHGHWQKQTLYQNATQVPLIVAGPGVTPGVGEFAELVDVYPTVCELAGINPPDALAGRSLVPVLSGKAESVRTSALSHHSEGYALREGSFRFVLWGENGMDGLELYDHSIDPDEMTNVASEAKYADVAADFSRRIRKRIADAKAKPKGLRQTKAATVKGIPHPEDIRERLYQ